MSPLPVLPGLHVVRALEKVGFEAPPDGEQAITLRGWGYRRTKWRGNF
jgi:hypothetical protein